MHHLMIGEGGHALIVLKGPACEVVPLRLFKIGVDQCRDIGLEGRFSLMRDEQGVFGEHALHVVAITGPVHDDGDESEPVLFRGLPQFRRLCCRNVVREGDPVVPGSLRSGEAGDHAIHLFGVAHVPPHEEPSILHIRLCEGNGRGVHRPGVGPGATWKERTHQQDE